MREGTNNMSVKTTYQGKWLNFCEREITDANGNPKIWEYVTRRNTTGKARRSQESRSRGTRTKADASCIVATTGGDDPRLILVKQFRPSVDSPVIEFPAGLIDADESAADTALRELEEETGYTCRVIDVGPAVYSSPGLTDESVVWVTVEVTGRKEQRLAADEVIEVIELPLNNLRAELQKLAEQGALIDAKLWFYAEGVKTSNRP